MPAVPKKLKLRFAQLTHRERLIAYSYASGLRGRKCTASTGAQHKTDASARVVINRVLAHPAAREYVEQLHAEAEASARAGALLSIQEKREFLARVVRTPITRLDPHDSDHPDGDLIKSYTITESQNGNSTRLEKIDPLKATLLDNDLAGHAQPKELKLAADDELSKILADLARHSEHGEM